MEVLPQFQRNTKSLEGTPQGENQDLHIKVGQGHQLNIDLRKIDMRMTVTKEMINIKIKMTEGDQEVGQTLLLLRGKNIGHGHHTLKRTEGDQEVGQTLLLLRGINIGQGHQI